MAPLVYILTIGTLRVTLCGRFFGNLTKHKLDSSLPLCGAHALVPAVAAKRCQVAAVPKRSGGRCGTSRSAAKRAIGPLQTVAGLFYDNLPGSSQGGNLAKKSGLLSGVGYCLSSPSSTGNTDRPSCSQPEGPDKKPLSDKDMRTRHEVLAQTPRPKMRRSYCRAKDPDTYGAVSSQGGYTRKEGKEGIKAREETRDEQRRKAQEEMAAQGR